MNKNEKTALVPRLRFPEFEVTIGWKKTALSQLGELISGLTYSPDDVRETGLLVLRSSNIKNNAITLDDNVYVRTDIRGANISLENDILICVRNGSKSLIGKNAIIPKGMPLCTHGAFMTVFRAENPQFVVQLFQSSAYEKQVQADLGATINSINGTQLRKYVFTTPENPKEQQKIADCLSSLDDLVIAEHKKLEALKAHKKGLMQKLFPTEGETVPEWRFPEFGGSGEWEETPLAQVGDIITGSTPSTTDADNYGGKKMFVSPADMTELKYVIETKTKLTEKGFMTTRKIPANSVLFVCIGSTIGKVAQNKCECATNQQINSVIPFEDYISDFIYYALEFNSSEISKLAGKQAVPIINKSLFSSVVISAPEYDEQQKIADCLSSIDDLISEQAKKIEALRTHKKGLMQGLFPSIEEVSE